MQLAPSRQSASFAAGAHDLPGGQLPSVVKHGAPGLPEEQTPTRSGGGALVAPAAATADWWIQRWSLQSASMLHRAPVAPSEQPRVPSALIATHALPGWQSSSARQRAFARPESQLPVA